MVKRTYQPKRRVHKRVHGFMARMLSLIHISVLLPIEPRIIAINKLTTKANIKL